MNKYHRLFFYSIGGFLFITVYLTMAIMSTNQEEEMGSRKSRRIVTIVEETSRKVDRLELTEAETRNLLRQVEVTNNERIQRVEDVCRKYNLGLFKSSNKESLEHPPVPQYSVFYFDKDDKLSFCPIYKAGSTTWLYNFCLLAGMTEEDIAASGKQLSEITRSRYPVLEPSAAEEAFLHTIKIITVRHPFERLLSAYRDKLENTNYGREHGTLHFYASFGSKIVKKYRKGGNKTKTWDLLKPSQYLWNPKHPKPEGIEPTFKEFVQYLNHQNLAHYADDHWIPYYLFCTPCLLRYDIIAKVETMNSDQLYAIHVLGLQNKIQPRWRHKTQFVQGNESQDTVSYLSKIYFGQLTVEEINKLYEKYKVDFDLFGYDHSEYLKYASDYAPNG